MYPVSKPSTQEPLLCLLQYWGYIPILPNVHLTAPNYSSYHSWDLSFNPFPHQDQPHSPNPLPLKTSFRVATLASTLA